MHPIAISVRPNGQEGAGPGDSFAIGFIGSTDRLLNHHAENGVIGIVVEIRSCIRRYRQKRSRVGSELDRKGCSDEGLCGRGLILDASSPRRLGRIDLDTADLADELLDHNAFCARIGRKYGRRCARLASKWGRWQEGRSQEAGKALVERVGVAQLASLDQVRDA